MNRLLIVIIKYLKLLNFGKSMMVVIEEQENNGMMRTLPLRRSRMKMLSPMRLRKTPS